jgi:hypothetical protein
MTARLALIILPVTSSHFLVSTLSRAPRVMTVAVCTARKVPGQRAIFQLWDLDTLAVDIALYVDAVLAVRAAQYARLHRWGSQRRAAAVMVVATLNFGWCLGRVFGLIRRPLLAMPIAATGGDLRVWPSDTLSPA